ncbi:hypothetical protein PVL29_006361 [Vitis rotundifolia]|uniref:Uncharacterized protein n=1 Tax=Vitis rotundifolia TaxID=103349 RepID=A0AA39DX11_VITRO|nr:hypothetical protein PVL29_006361 [Vitis rotundifolia]
MDVELATTIWPMEMIYDSTLTAMGIPNAPTPVALWPTTDDLSLIGMGMLDLLVEVAIPKTLKRMDVELAAVIWLAEMIYD